VLLDNGAQSSALLKKINDDPQRPGMVGVGKARYSLEPLSASYFNPANKTTYMHMRNPLFIKIGIMACALVLFMASFNFISLLLLSLQGRNKEAGVKKMLGVSWWDVVRASSMEVGLYVVVAFAIAITLMSLVLPSFNTVVEGTLALGYLSRLDVMLWIGVIVFALGLIVILFSVAQQRKVKPVSLMRKAGVTKVAFSKTLFTIQFIVSITLAICAIATIKQMHFLENEPLGFNRNIIRLQSPAQSLNARLIPLKQDLLQIRGVQHASIVSGNPVSGNWMARYELEDGKFYTPYLFAGDEDMFATLDLTLLEGELPSATRTGKVVNEKLVKLFNMEHPLGEKVPGTEDRIIGVVKDFTCTSFKDEIQPAILSYTINNSRMLIDYNGQSVGTLLPEIQKAWIKNFPDHPFVYQVIQEELLKKYKEETFFYKTMVTFAITTLVISCFGLFALSWAVSQSRTKEMGIRKVLGATARDVMNLLTMSFLRHILIAFAIAAPAGYYLMNEWLAHFAKRIPLGISVFAMAGVAVIIIAFFTMGIQTLKAARTNPVEEIKSE
jgi:putative ABC transport system permease protein